MSAVCQGQRVNPPLELNRDSTVGLCLSFSKQRFILLSVKGSLFMEWEEVEGFWARWVRICGTFLLIVSLSALLSFWPKASVGKSPVTICPSACGWHRVISLIGSKAAPLRRLTSGVSTNIRVSPEKLGPVRDQRSPASLSCDCC